MRALPDQGLDRRLRPFRRAWRRPSEAVVIAAALAAGGGAAWIAATSGSEANPTAAAVLACLVGWTFIGCGVVARRQRPSNPLGWVMIYIGFTWFATYLADASSPVVFTVGTAVEDLYLVGFVYVILTFPSGRLDRRIDRWFFGAALFLSTVVEVVWLVFADSQHVFCDNCPRNELEISRHDELARALLNSQRILGVALSIATLVLLVRRWRRASSAHRRAVAPVLWAGSGMFAALAFSVANDTLGTPLGDAPAWTRSVAFAAVPVALVAVLVQRRLARGAVAALVVELGERPQRLDLRDAIARALGDPSLEVAYWLPEGARYVDDQGVELELPNEGGGRAVTRVERGGEPVAALVHDAALRENTELVDSVCAAAALALENERLQAELRARLAELRASRARIVEATDEERRRIERDLHDGTQQRLVSIALSLGLADARLDADPAGARPAVRKAKDEIALALTELRELSQGIRPGVLVERGLPGALQELASRAPVPVDIETNLEGRLPDAVEATAYFVASEALANVAKHSRATVCALAATVDGGVLTLEIADDGVGGASAGAGTGLRGLSDRVEALGGRLSVTSPAGRGTVVRGEIPLD